MTYFSGTKRAVDTGDTYFAEIAQEKIGGRFSKPSQLNRGRLKQLPIASGASLRARIDHARFIVDCPNCGSAEFAFEDRFFWCTTCSNSDVNGRVRKVIMPQKRKAIETILELRPIKSRNWNPGETIERLEQENIEHGVG